MPASIRITLTPKIERVLKDLQEERFGLLEPAEIIRAILSEYDALRQRRLSSRPSGITDPEWSSRSAWEGTLPMEQLAERQWKDIDEARKEPGVKLSREELWQKVSRKRPS